MKPLSRRQLLARGSQLALGAFALGVPELLYRPEWMRLAAAQTLPTVEATFVAAVEAVTNTADVPTARWVIGEFDRALPPLPDGTVVTAAVAALLDARTLAAGYPSTFALATPEQRREVLRRMVSDPVDDIRQVANQLVPFCGYGYFSDATLDEPAEPGGPRLERWDEIGFPGPSHSYADTYRDGGPEGFAPMPDHEP